jgi:hypothetical protein
MSVCQVLRLRHSAKQCRRFHLLLQKALLLIVYFLALLDCSNPLDLPTGDLSYFYITVAGIATNTIDTSEGCVAAVAMALFLLILLRCIISLPMR